MKSDVIRKRARPEARKGSPNSGTPSASPGNSARASPAGDQQSSSSANNPYDFSASTFEFSQVTLDTTDRLTHQHETHDSGVLSSALSPGTATYLDTLQLQYPPAPHLAQPTDHHHDLNHAFEFSTNFEQAFQDDGSKRRRVSPDNLGLDHTAVASASSESTASSLLSGPPSSVEQSVEGTPYGPHSPVFDPFSPYFPYQFTFAPTPPGWLHPPLTSYHLTEEERNDLLAGKPVPGFAASPMEDPSM